MKRLLVAAALASSYALASSAGQTQPAKQGAEFAPRKAYRECLNRNFAAVLPRERSGRSPDTIAEGALLACRAEERALAAFAEELMPIVKDRMKDCPVDTCQRICGGKPAVASSDIWPFAMWPAVRLALAPCPLVSSRPASPPAPQSRPPGPTGSTRSSTTACPRRRPGPSLYPAWLRLEQALSGDCAHRGRSSLHVIHARRRGRGVRA
jgi:hypothetical protein